MRETPASIGRASVAAAERRLARPPGADLGVAAHEARQEPAPRRFAEGRGAAD